MSKSTSDLGFFFVGRVRVSMKIRSWLKSCSVHLTLVLKVSSLVQLLTAVVLWLNWLLWYLFVWLSFVVVRKMILFLFKRFKESALSTVLYSV